jgi:hypothetical protein
MRTLTFGILAGAGIALGSPTAFAQSTTRIEPRPFYGATVTLEEGVRVFRPLPPHDRVIINPGGRTPLYLSIGEGGSYSQNYGASYISGAPGGVGRFLPRGRHPHRVRSGH